ncbi:UNVERIFIED_CONTAM: hypothetical protein PYX00_011592 [Menopon gallinae]|uniref:Iron hydrogenase large subunit C-terminal domain-containing protein n=1 Tax=Menopon gallinae TaxID=328185 RepID=A0AAW2H874_9NEOP
MLRTCQRKRVIGFLSPGTQSPWKVLVLDSRTQDIISPLLHVNELRECNITAHFLLETKRGRVRDTPAIYFVEETEKNIDTIARDVLDDTYSEYHINFTGAIRRPLLERLATALSEKGRGLFVRSIFDQYMNFVALQENLFTLHRKNTFSDPVDSGAIVQALFGVFLTLGEAPFIVPQGDSELGERLLKLIRSTKLLRDTRKKPLLILIDRQFDIRSPVEHVWTYSSLIKDLLPFDQNKVFLKAENKTLELDPADDFWMKNSEEYFPVVAERVERELVDYKKEMALRCVDEKSDKKKIEEALEKAPELVRKKAAMHTHMSICLALVDLIKKRSIDDFYKIERSSFKKQDLLEISEKGEGEDILRLAISMLRSDNASVVETLLQKRKVDTRILKFFRGAEAAEQRSGTSYRQVVSSIMGSVKKLLPVSNESPLSKHVEGILSSIKGQDTEELGILNPFGQRCFEKEISRVIVFCNGGGTYTELKSLNELGKKLGLEMIYGTTEVINSADFLEQVRRVVNGALQPTSCAHQHGGPRRAADPPVQKPLSPAPLLMKAQPAPMKQVAMDRKCTKETQPLELTLSDCLACSGCITRDEERLLEQSDYQRLIEDNTEKLFMISPYSKVSIYSEMCEGQGLSFQDFESSLTAFLKTSCNAVDVVDTSYFQRTVLEMVADEFFGSSVPIITSDCPGTVAYIEKNGKHLLENLSRVLSPQQMCAVALEKRGRVTSVVPCYDKKMENGRDRCAIDYVLSTREFMDFLAHRRFSAAECSEGAMRRERTVFPYGSFSGGYTEFLLEKIGPVHVDAVQTSRGHYVYRCEGRGKTYTLHKVYGVKNVLNMISRTRKKLDFDFAEVFLCEEACAYGPSRTGSTHADIKPLYSMLEGSGIAEEVLQHTSAKRVFRPAAIKKTHFAVDW